MRTVEEISLDLGDLEISSNNGNILLCQGEDIVALSPDNQKKLIDVLGDFMKNKCKQIGVNENGDCLHFHTTFDHGECFDCGKNFK